MMQIIFHHSSNRSHIWKASLFSPLAQLCQKGGAVLLGSPQPPLPHLPPPLAQATVPCSMCNISGVTLFYRQGSDSTSCLVADGYDCRVTPTELGTLGWSCSRSWGVRAFSCWDSERTCEKGPSQSSALGPEAFHGWFTGLNAINQRNEKSSWAG